MSSDADYKMKKVQSIQYLRAMAALMVVGVHLEQPLRRLGYDGLFPSFLASGVDIFFVISGVVMWLSTDGRNVTSGNFLLRRIIRIVPMYWLLTAFFTVILLVAPGIVSNGKFDISHVVASFLFIPWAHPSFSGNLFPVLVPGWTINAEMFFYVVFSVALMLSPRWRVAAVSALFGCLVVAGMVLKPSGSLSFYTHSLFLEFAIGLLVGQIYTSGYQFVAGVAAKMLLAGVVGLALFPVVESFWGQIDRLVVRGLPAALVVCGMIHLERAGAVGEYKTLSFLGDASYSIYLVQPIPLAAWSFLLARASLFLAPATLRIVYVPLALASTMIAGCLAYLLVERPMTDRLLRWCRPRPATPHGISQVAAGVSFGGK